MIIGIDIGTQSLKAVVVDQLLCVRGEAAVPYQPSFPQPGWAEQNPELWLAALAPAIGRALHQAKIKPTQISALGIGGQLDGCIALRRDGRVVHPCLIWMDRRAESELSGLPAADIQKLTGVMLDASHMAAKIRWLKSHIVQAKTGCIFHQPSSYLVYRLCGSHVMDHGLASTTMLYSLANRDFDPHLLDLFGIARAELPEIARAEARAGEITAQGSRLTGLPEGTTVAVGTGDDFSTPLGAGVISPGCLVCVLGTAEVVGAVHSEAILDDQCLVETHAYPGGKFLIENPGWLSGGALTWFKQVLKLDQIAEFDRLAGTVPPGAEGLTFLPGLSGTMAPEWVASARACFYGLTPAHSRAHMARAVLEGTAFAMRDVADRLKELGVSLNRIILLGGGAKSELWAAIRADLTGLPVDIPRNTDTAPVGSALLAAVAVGALPDLPSAIERLNNECDTVAPNNDHRPAYAAAYGAYRQLFYSLRPMFQLAQAPGIKAETE